MSLVPSYCRHGRQNDTLADPCPECQPEQAKELADLRALLERIDEMPWSDLIHVIGRAADALMESRGAEDARQRLDLIFKHATRSRPVSG